MIEICRWTVSVVYGTTANVAGAAIQNFWIGVSFSNRIGTSDSNSNRISKLHRSLSRTQEFQVGQQPILNTGCGNRESPVTNLPTRSWYDRRHCYSMNSATTVKECQRRASTGWQCNRERAWQTSCAQAGTACTLSVFYSLYSLYFLCDWQPMQLPQSRSDMTCKLRSLYVIYIIQLFKRFSW